MDMLLRQAKALLESTRDPWANMANLSAFLYERLENVNWAGFYRVRKDGLLLGPFQGKPACVHLPLGKGVCARSAETERSVMVDDVHAFPGHIACDADSRSELVIPVFNENRVIAVLDIDSPRPARFTEQDKVRMETLVRLLEKHTDWSTLT
ncbi:MAG: GAF domain-containing protein [Calditrichaeota bacterium]|nr:MAG: GAF domain-containing protein [Calditrichota bacterium]